jgi:hypothetical protein
MATTTSVVIPPDGLTNRYRLLIVKVGAKPSAEPASFYYVGVDTARAIGDPYAFRDYLESLPPFNTAMSIKVNTMTGRGAMLVERFNGPAASATFSGTAPKYVSPFRWTVKPFGISQVQGETWIDIEGEILRTGITNPNTVNVYHRTTIGSGNFSLLQTKYMFVSPVSGFVGAPPPESTLVATGTGFGEFMLGSDDNILTGVEAAGEGTPSMFWLGQNYPNPFNPTTMIQLSVPARGRVELVVFNILGQKVRSLFSGDQQDGIRVVQFDGRDDRGNILPSGIYLYRLTAGTFADSKKMLLVR